MQAESQYVAPPQPAVESAIPSAPAYISSSSGTLYPSLGDYMGLELNEDTIAQNMPEYALATRSAVSYICIYILY